MGTTCGGDPNTEIEDYVLEANYCARLQEIRDEGLRAYPGSKIGNGGADGCRACEDPEHWRRVAGLFNAILACSPDDEMIVFDGENYLAGGGDECPDWSDASGGAVAGDYSPTAQPTIRSQAIKASMQPFLDAVAASGRRIGFYPANPNDLVMRHLLDVAGDGSEAWTETLLLAERAYLSNPADFNAALAKERLVKAKIETRHPSVHFRSGYGDEILRNWAKPFRDNFMVGARVWLQDISRYDNYDREEWGTGPWLSGATMNGPGDSLYSNLDSVWPMRAKGGISEVSQNFEEEERCLIDMIPRYGTAALSAGCNAKTAGAPLVGGRNLPFQWDFKEQFYESETYDLKPLGWGMGRKWSAFLGHVANGYLQPFPPSPAQQDFDRRLPEDGYTMAVTVVFDDVGAGVSRPILSMHNDTTKKFRLWLDDGEVLLDVFDTSTGSYLTSEIVDDAPQAGEGRRYVIGWNAADFSYIRYTATNNGPTLTAETVTPAAMASNTRLDVGGIDSTPPVYIGSTYFSGYMVGWSTLFDGAKMLEAIEWSKFPFYRSDAPTAE